MHTNGQIPTLHLMAQINIIFNHLNLIYPTYIKFYFIYFFPIRFFFTHKLCVFSQPTSLHNLLPFPSIISYHRNTTATPSFRSSSPSLFQSPFRSSSHNHLPIIIILFYVFFWFEWTVCFQKLIWWILLLLIVLLNRLLIMWIKLFNIPCDQVAHQVFDEMCEWKIFDNFVICSCNFAY